ncbi:MAG: aminotransferase class I/II-fold pyridoxal phosphate-dependent enzyme [Nitrospiraceae bacterium]|nr:aminotransferase class I/II-fold pyridoxal phosphate-dependent enzyme [Nitrospiraceae bacterium]
MELNIHTFSEEQKKGMRRVTDVSAGISPLGPSKKVKAAIRKAARDIGTYADPDCGRLKTFFASRSGIGNNRIFFANSCREIIFLARNAFRPERIVLAGPADMPTASPSGKDVVFTDGDGLDQSQLRSGDLLLVSNPNRITGRLADRERLLTVLKAASASCEAIILDEALIEFTSDDRFYDGQDMPENLVIMRTTANFYGLPGLELSYAVSSPQTIAHLGEVFRPRPNHLAMEGARAAFRDRTYIRTTRKFISYERERLFHDLGKIRGLQVHQSDSNIFLAEVASGGEKVLRRLNREGFMIRDCDGIQNLGKQYLRLSVMSHDRNRKLVRILREGLAQGD